MKTEFLDLNKTKNYLYQLPHKISRKIKDKIASVLNSQQFPYIRDLMVNLTGTGLIASIAIWLFGINVNPLRVGFGIAVTLAGVQYYIKWYYSIKK